MKVKQLDERADFEVNKKKVLIHSLLKDTNSLFFRMHTADAINLFYFGKQTTRFMLTYEHI